MAALPLYPRLALQSFLEVHEAQRVGAVGIVGVRVRELGVGEGLLHERRQLRVEVLGVRLDDHAGIAPGRPTVAGAHAVHDELLRPARGGDHETAGTHAETVDAAPVDLGRIAVFSRGQVLAPPRAAVVLDAVDDVRRVLQAHTDGDAFLLEEDTLGVQVAVDVAGGVPRGQDDRAAESLPCGRHDADRAAAVGRA